MMNDRAVRRWCVISAYLFDDLLSNFSYPISTRRTSKSAGQFFFFKFVRQNFSYKYSQMKQTG